MNWHIELTKRGFYLCNLATKTYGNGKITGSIVYEKPNKDSITKDGTICDETDKDAKPIFCPFVKADSEYKPNYNFQTIRLRTEDDLNQYLYY